MLVKEFSIKSILIVGVGNVKIEMFEGVIKTLTYVRHVPKFNKKIKFFGSVGFLWT